MPQSGDRAPLLMVSLERDSGVSMQRQIFDQVRDAILDGRLVPGRRLPSTRALASELSVSRNTVLAAYDQLYAEGYTEGEVGSGTRVSTVLPEEVLAARTAHGILEKSERPVRDQLSETGRALLAGRKRVLRPRSSAAFRPGVPEIDSFPWTQWSRMVAKFWRHPPRDLISYGEPGGYQPLRGAISEYLNAVRGLHSSADQVIVTSGAQQAIDLIIRAFVNTGDKVWIEDPGYAGIKGSLTAAGAELVPVPVDDAGLDVDHALRSAPDAKMAIVTPSHQYPLGSVMSLSRRLQLLEWAADTDAWILEDDYDSEYRYAGRPLSALQGLDRRGSVIYVGTFSKVLFPGIRLGYMVAPPSLVEPILEIRRALDDQTAIAMQPVLAEFIESGHFAAHIRRMRTLYAHRQKVLIDALSDNLSDVLDVSADEAGMHLVARIKPDCHLSDQDIADEATKHGLTVYPLSSFCIDQKGFNGLVLGYASVEEKVIREGVVTLAKLITSLQSTG